MSEWDNFEVGDYVWFAPYFDSRFKLGRIIEEKEVKGKNALIVAFKCDYGLLYTTQIPNHHTAEVRLPKEWQIRVGKWFLPKDSEIADFVEPKAKAWGLFAKV